MTNWRFPVTARPCLASGQGHAPVASASVPVITAGLGWLKVSASLYSMGHSMVSERVGDGLFLFYNALSFHRLNHSIGRCVPVCMDKSWIRLDMDRLLLSFVVGQAQSYQSPTCNGWKVQSSARCWQRPAVPKLPHWETVTKYNCSQYMSM